MTVGEQIELLKERTARLQNLLQDPQVGLATWMMAVGRTLDSIAELAPSYRKVDEDRR